MPSPGSILRDRLTALFLSQGRARAAGDRRDHGRALHHTAAAGQRHGDCPAPELVQEQLDASHLATLPLELGLRMDLYGIVTRKHHQLAPGPAVLLDLLREGGRQRYGAASTSSSGLYKKLGCSVETNHRPRRHSGRGRCHAMRSADSCAANRHVDGAAARQSCAGP